MEARTDDGCTALCVAAQFPVSLECARVLFERGAVVDAKDNNNSTPLLIAAYFGNEEIVRLLLSFGADRLLKDDDDQTAVDAAESGGHAVLANRLRNPEWPQSVDEHKWNDGDLLALVRSRGVQRLLDARLKEEIGSGGGGTAFLCKDHGVSVVVKCLSIGISDNDAKSATSMMLTEAKILFNLRHPHIVQLLGVSDSPPALILEHAELGSLDGVLDTFAHGEVPTSIMLWFGFQISCGVEYLHSERVLHRDIKSSNVLVFGGFVLKLADFGLSRSQNRGTLYSIPKGTPTHVAPECFERKLSLASDVYALAITLWEIASLRKGVDWLEKPPLVLLQAVTRGERPSLTHVHDSLHPIICDSWNQDRKLRPTAGMVRMRLELLYSFNPHTRSQVRVMEDKFFSPTYKMNFIL